jgi:hypothetical protein
MHARLRPQGPQSEQPALTVRVKPVPAALMDSTAARTSALLWKSFTRPCRAPVATLPSMRM